MKSILILSIFLVLVAIPAFAQILGADLGCSPGIYSNGSINSNLVRSTFRFSMTSAINSKVWNCTGCLVNQLVNGKPRQYFLTARHCIREGSGGGAYYRFDNVRFVFDFQSPNGVQNAIPDVAPSILGNRGNPYFRYEFTSPVNLQYESSGLFGSGLGIDIAMLEIVQPIPPHFNVFYAGWKSDALLGSGGVLNAPMNVIHHPAGDAKKYSQTYYIDKTEGRLATGCRVVFRIIDAFFNFFGGKANLETVCSYIDIPQYAVPLLTTGAISGGSSGSPFFTNGDRLFAVTSTAFLGDCAKAGTTFGKFRNAFAERQVKEPLNPSYNINASFFGINGQAIGCYPDNPLLLSGNYFPAGDYQPQNRQYISSDHTIQAGAIPGSLNTAARVNSFGVVANPVGNGIEEGLLRIYSGADFVFTARESIRLVDGFEVQAGASFSALIQPCGVSTRKASLVDALPEVILPPVQDLEEKEDQLLISPNPATGEVRCRYALQQPSAVRISVFNMSGQEVQSLFESAEQPIGSYDVPGNVAGLPAGSYIVQMKAGAVKKAAHLVVSH